MRILIVCDQGNNRSVVLAHQLKYWRHDILAVGRLTNSVETVDMLMNSWADRIIAVDRDIYEALDARVHPLGKLELWEIGPDIYKRPFNPELLRIVKQLIEDHREEYGPKRDQ